VQSLKDAGLPDSAIDDMRPTINEACVEAMEVWNMLGGWFPERLPVILDMVGAYYVDGLIERLVSIREGLNSKDDDG